MVVTAAWAGTVAVLIAFTAGAHAMMIRMITAITIHFAFMFSSSFLANNKTAHFEKYFWVSTQPYSQICCFQFEFTCLFYPSKLINLSSPSS